MKKILDSRVPAPTVAPPGPAEEAAPGPPAPSLDELEKAHIRSLLRQFQGNRASVARAMGVTERTVYRKLTRYGLS